MNQLTYTIIAKKDRVEDSYHYLSIAQANKLKKKLEADGFIVNLIREDAFGNIGKSRLG